MCACEGERCGCHWPLTLPLLGRTRSTWSHREHRAGGAAGDTRKTRNGWTEGRSWIGGKSEPASLDDSFLGVREEASRGGPAALREVVGFSKSSWGWYPGGLGRGQFPCPIGPGVMRKCALCMPFLYLYWARPGDGVHSPPTVVGLWELCMGRSPTSPCCSPPSPGCSRQAREKRPGRPSRARGEYLRLEL